MLWSSAVTASPAPNRLRRVRPITGASSTRRHAQRRSGPCACPRAGERRSRPTRQGRRYRPLDGCEARIIGRDDQAIITITVNDRGGPRRRRFSLAHEIGHWTHHRGRCLVCRADDINRGGENRPLMEKTADRYAANLLMPPYLLRPVLS